MDAERGANAGPFRLVDNSIACNAASSTPTPHFGADRVYPHSQQGFGISALTTGFPSLIQWVMPCVTLAIPS